MSLHTMRFYRLISEWVKIFPLFRVFIFHWKIEGRYCWQLLESMYLHVKVDFTREYCKWLDFYVDTLLIMLFQSLDLSSTDIQQLTQCMVLLLTAYTSAVQKHVSYFVGRCLVSRNKLWITDCGNPDNLGLIFIEQLMLVFDFPQVMFFCY